MSDTPKRRSSLVDPCSPKRKDSRVSIGDTRIEEIEQLKAVYGERSEWEPLPEVSQKRIPVTIRRTGGDLPEISRSMIYGWTCTCGESDSKLTVKLLCELLTQAIEEYEGQQRTNANAMVGKPVMKEGSLKILWVTMASTGRGSEEIDVFEERPIDLPDGGIVICHADLIELQPNPAMCLACTCILQ